MAQLNNINPTELTFSVQHKILRIAGKGKKIIYQSHVNHFKNQYKLEWKIERNDPNNIISSPIVGDMFNASYNRNDNSVILRLCGLSDKHEIDGYQVQWPLNIKECNLWYQNVSSFKFKAYDDWGYPKEAKLDIYTFDMGDYKEMDQFTFCVDVKILNEIDMNGNIIDNRDIEQKWDQYIKNEDMIKKNREKQKQELDYDWIDDRDEEKENQQRLDERHKFEEWLESIGLVKYYGIFVLQGLGHLDTICNLDENQLRDIGVDEEDRLKMIHYIDKLQDQIENFGTKGFEFKPYHETNSI